MWPGWSGIGNAMPMSQEEGLVTVLQGGRLAIETALTLRLLFRLPRRQTEGFLGSVLTLMGLSLPCPDHTTLSRRNATVAIRQQVDHAPQKHGEKKCKRWKKLHLGVDNQGHIMASCVTDGHEQDPAPVPELLSPIEQEIDRFIGDGIYDQAPVYTAVERHSPGARVIMPPRKEAVLSATAAIECDGVFHWRRTSGYDGQSRAENAFSRFKRTFGGGLRAKRDESQEREAALACQLLNRMLGPGRPQSYPVL